MGRRRRRTHDDDDDDVDMTSYDDVTRSSALLAYVKLSSTDRHMGISVVGYLGQAGGLYVSRVNSERGAMLSSRRTSAGTTTCCSNSSSGSGAMLQPGDRINSINGLRLNHLDNDNAFQLLRATVARQLGREHTVRLGVIRSRDVVVLRHWQRWNGDYDTATTTTHKTTTGIATTGGQRSRVVVQESPVTDNDNLYFTTTRF